MGKVLTAKALVKEISKLKKSGKTIVFTNGCFDILHPGHIKVLKQAKNKGDILVVGVNSDFSIKKIKGASRPILDQKSRTILVSNIVWVDYVVLFNQDTPYALIKKIKPDILVKGGDWTKKNIVGSDITAKVYRVKLAPGISTTKIIEKIRKSGR